jgi:beta-propeller repeat-containing protein
MPRCSSAPVRSVVLVLGLVATNQTVPSHSALDSARPRIISSYGKLPLHFEANQGQTASDVNFLARGKGYSLFLSGTESMLVLRKQDKGAMPMLHFKLLGSNPAPVVTGNEELPGKSNYFIGNDPTRWRTNVAHYARVELAGVYPGIDLTYYGNQGQIEYDFLVKPHADPAKIRLAVEGAERVRVDGDGNLILSVPGGDVIQRAPVIYQEADGVRKAIDGRFAMRGPREIGFEVGPYAPDQPLVVDAPGTSELSSLATKQPSTEQKPRIIAGYGNRPLHFEPNHGQTAREVKFLARGEGYGVFLTPTESVLVLRSREGAQRTLRLRLIGANPTLVVAGMEELPGKSNYFVGNDPGKWHTNVPQFGRVEYREVYPGIDLAYYGNHHGLEYDFVLKPGADSRWIRLRITGDGRVHVDRDGNLLIRLPDGEVVHRAPVAYQEIDGVRNAVAARFVLRGQHEVGFAVGAYAPDHPLVLDPVLAYSTYLGGTQDDIGQAIAVDASGSAYVTGYTDSLNFPTTNLLPPGSGQDAFVSKLGPDGSVLVYSTYLGGNANDAGLSVAVDAQGSAYITGYTYSSDFPTANALQATRRGGVSAFVTKLSPTGSLAYSTYLGGTGGEFGWGVAVDASANAYVTGYTFSTDFPTVSPIQAANGGQTDAYVAKLNASGSALIYSTYLGGTDSDLGIGIAIDASGNAYVSGETRSTDFPTFRGAQPASGGGYYDAFVAKLNAAGSAFVYSTYLGGSGPDFGAGIAVDASGSAYVTGLTESVDFPTVNALQPAYAGGQDAFVTKLNDTGSALAYSTYLGGTRRDYGRRIAVDSSGNAYVTGTTSSSDFPTVNRVQAWQGLDDAFVTKLSSSGSSLIYSTYLGGGGFFGVGSDYGSDIALDASRGVYVVGSTSSTKFPTVHPVQAAYGGGPYDAFVAKIVGDDNASRFFIVPPCRLVDTDWGGFPLRANSTLTFTAAGFCGIPNTATAIAINLTTAQQTDSGYLRVYAAEDPVPPVSTLNFSVNLTRANNAIVMLGANGAIAVTCVMPTGSTGTTRVIVDVTGYFQ